MGFVSHQGGLFLMSGKMVLFPLCSWQLCSFRLFVASRC